MTLTWILAALALIAFAMGIHRLYLARKDAAFLKRLEEESWQRYTDSKYEPTLTEEEVAEYHKMRWD